MIPRLVAAVFACAFLPSFAPAQTAAAAVPPPLRRPPAPPSPDVLQDGRVTFRIFAPQAHGVVLAGDIYQGLPHTGPTLSPPSSIPFTKAADGTWTATSTQPFLPGAWRYHFLVDDAPVTDRRNPLTSPYQVEQESLLVIPGDFSETRPNIPHGTLAIVRYPAPEYGAGTLRELYVYTPPGYERSAVSLPVLYLIHGGGETAASWATVGRTSDILDNLIAEGKALPMIVVMPSGWTPRGPQVMTADASLDPFNHELMQDIVPFVDGHYRTIADADHRALAGLSMGGIQTLNIGLSNLGSFRYLGVFSSGWFPADRDVFFADAQAKRFSQYNGQLRLFWWAWGKTDIARENAIACTTRFRQLGVRLQTEETPDGHEWKNWRLYLSQFTPQLFRP